MIDYREIVRMNFSALRILGVYSPKNESKWYKLYSFSVTALLFFVYMLSEIINIILAIPDVEEITDSSFLLLTHLVMLVKLCFLVKNESKLATMVEKLNDKRCKPRNLKQENMGKQSIRNSKITFVGCVFMCGSTIFFWALVPLMDQHSKPKSLPLKAWYPFDTKKSPVYELTYAYQIAAVMYGATVNTCFDTASSAGFMSYVCTNLDMLNDTLSHLREEAKVTLERKKRNGWDFGIVDPEETTPEIQREMDEILGNCAEHYSFIIE